MRAVLLIILSGWLLAAGGVAFGAASGLNVMPTADVMLPRTFTVELERTGPGTLLSGQSGGVLNSQFGLGYGVEAGLDLGAAGEDKGDFFWNAKWQFFEDENGLLAAVGVQNVSPGFIAQPYAAVAVPFSRTRIHPGFIGTEGRLHPMFGFDYLLTPRLVIQGDHIGGSENGSSLGFVWAIGEHFSINLARIWPNSPDEQANNLLILSYAAEL